MTKILIGTELRTFAEKKGALKAVKRDSSGLPPEVSILDLTAEQEGDRWVAVVELDHAPSEQSNLDLTAINGFRAVFSRKEEPAAPKPEATPTAPKGSRRKGQITVAPTAPLIQCREGSKQQAIVETLATGCVFDQPVYALIEDKVTGQIVQGDLIGYGSVVGGASMTDLRKVCVKGDGTPWDDNSIRSSMYFDLELKGYGTSTRFVDGEPIYTLRLPLGYDTFLGPKIKS